MRSQREPTTPYEKVLARTIRRKTKHSLVIADELIGDVLSALDKAGCRIVPNHAVVGWDWGWDDKVQREAE